MSKKISKFRMPAEWEPQKSVWMAWPHNKNDWPGLFKKIPNVVGKIIKYLTNVSNILTCYKCILDCSEENVGFYEKCKYSNKGNFMAIYFN